MTKRFIDVEELDYVMCSIYWGEDEKGNDVYYRTEVALKTNIEQIPAADVVEVKHGEWKDLSSAEWQCSECNYKVERWNNTPYCPNCGARMDGDING